MFELLRMVNNSMTEHQKCISYVQWVCKISELDEGAQVTKISYRTFYVVD